MPLHSWNLTPKEAIALQRELAGRVDATRPLGPCRYVGGMDLSYDKLSPISFAAVVVLDARTMAVVEVQGATGLSPFPYVPGLLSFREAPLLLEAWGRLRCRPDVVLIDGQGLAHPRRFGIACHLGLWLDVPTVGCAKSLLIGTYREPGRKRGCSTRLLDGDETIGRVVRTKDGTKPVFVSSGHGVRLEDAVRLVLRCGRGYRIPEPTRQAHLQVNALRRGASTCDDQDSD